MRLGSRSAEQRGLIRMKPGRLSCAGLAIIMMVLPDALWKGAPPQANMTVVVRVGDAGAGGRDPTRQAHDVELDQTILSQRECAASALSDDAERAE